MLDNKHREIFPIQNLNMDFLKQHVIPLGINRISGVFKLNDTDSMSLDIHLDDYEHIYYSLKKSHEHKWNTIEEKEIPLSQLTRLIKSFYNKGNQIPDSDLEISFYTDMGKWGDKYWFVFYGDSVNPTLLRAHSCKAPAKKSAKKFPKVNVRAMF